MSGRAIKSTSTSRCSPSRRRKRSSKYRALRRARSQNSFGKPGDILQVGAPLIEFVGKDGESDQAKAVNPDAGTVVGRVEKGNEVTREKATVAGRATAVKATPAVRALARRLEVDLAVVTPSGPNDTVTVRDVERVARIFRELGPLEQLRGVRRTMARSMAQAHAEVAPVTVSDDADLACLVARESGADAATDSRDRGRLQGGARVERVVRQPRARPARARGHPSRHRRRHARRAVRAGAARHRQPRCRRSARRARAAARTT